jgi:hypothetical protein
MSKLFAKLNLKDQREIFVLDAPASFEAEVLLLDGVRVKRKVGARDKVGFAIAFATTQSALDAASAALAKAADGDAILWFAYPKGKSKRYTCEFNRDSGWSVLGDAGYEAVRQVSIDEDWSALRFRAVEFIKSFTRAPHRASSALGKVRAAP